MKRLISILLLIIMLCAPVTAYAADDSIRHEVYGDVSEFEVSTEQSVGKPNSANTEATMGTEVWLFVDPDTASYVTFYVTDEEGNPLKDANIYISYNGKSEFFGSTDKDGKFKTYLFRDVEYGYTVTKYGYEDASGTFTAAKETKTVRVVLRRYYSLEILVVDGDEPVRDTVVYIDGQRYVTDKDGKVKTSRTNGVYDILVITEDGREIPVRVEVDGETKLIVDISQDDSIVDGGRYTDSFLVYNKDYDPEDYVLTEYKFTADDVDEKKKDSYLKEVSNTILIEAQPERRQNSDGTDTDIMKDGEPLYARRSLMPSGWLMKAWEQQEYENIVFSNEDMAVKFPISELHNEKMMKLYAAMWYLSDFRVNYPDIATEAVQKKWNGYERSGLTLLAKWNLDPKTIAFDAIKDDFRFDFTLSEDEKKEDKYTLLPESYYTNALFEIMLTPIQRDAMEDMIFEGLRGQKSLPQDEIMLASWGYFQEELRRHLAEGRLSEREHDELYQFFVDGKLSKEELKELKKQYTDGKLSRTAVELMLDAAANE
ncbi:MAG: hypothetical protein IJ364_02420, partial [Oscillospiraceae bacterium]|nr:hypothetical protein [Oscillospiraceae bacterium]